MKETRYHPLVDMDDSGKRKTPMFFSNSESTVRNNHDFYLKETISGYYRLCSAKASPAPLFIGCPHCGKEMMPITNSQNTNNGALYCCPHCKPRKTQKGLKI